MKDPELVLNAGALLGEGPVWDSDRNQLYWVDITGKEVHIYNPKDKTDRAINVGQYVGAIVPREKGGLVTALQNGLYFLDEETSRLSFITAPESHLPDNRFNDGKCDPAGRFWVGTMNQDGEVTGAGSLYRLDTDLSVQKVLEGVTISNGIVWHPDGKSMYYIDTPTREVWAFEYDIKTGEIANKRTAVSISVGDGFPDGMTIDTEGMIWVALWGGWKVTRYNPLTGERLGEIKMPVAQVTSCVFGGDNLDELYITSARIGLKNDELEKQPYAGGLFKVKVDVKGARSFKFLG